MSSGAPKRDWRKTLRSVDSFGVAGVLDSGSQVYYENLVSTKGLGRVSDLIHAQLNRVLAERAQEAATLELRLRAALLYCAIEGLRHREGLEPVLLECGLDNQLCAISASFTLSSSIEGTPDDSWTRLDSVEGASAEFSALLRYLSEHVEHVFLKWQASTRKVELVAVCDLDAKTSTSRCEVEWVALEQSIDDTPEVHVYEELGDLPYQDLLQDTPISAGVDATPTGDFLVRSSQQAIEQRTKIGGTTDNHKDVNTVVKGATEPKDDHQTVIKSSPIEEKGAELSLKRLPGVKEAQAPSKRALSPQAAPASAEDGEYSDSPQARQYLEKIQELQGKVAALESEKIQLRQEINAERLKTREAIDVSKAQAHLLAKKTTTLSSTEPADQESIEAVGEASTDHATPAPAAEAAPAPEPVEPDPPLSTETSDQAESLVKEIEVGGLAGTIQRLQRESVEVKKDLKTEKAQRFVDGMMSELMKERSKLNDMAKRLSESFRHREMEFHQKEIQFKNREREFTTGIKGLEKNVSQKEATITRMREQVAQLTMQVERAKMQQQNQAMNSKGKQSAAELSALQIKFDRVQRQLEEFKKANQQLSEKVTESQKSKDSSGGGGGGTSELKARLEASMKMLTLSKKQNEQLKGQVDQTKREELRLKGELNRLTTELNTVKSSYQKSQSQMASQQEALSAQSGGSASPASQAAKKQDGKPVTPARPGSRPRKIA